VTGAAAGERALVNGPCFALYCADGVEGDWHRRTHAEPNYVAEPFACSAVGSAGKVGHPGHIAFHLPGWSTGNRTWAACWVSVYSRTETILPSRTVKMPALRLW